MATVEEFKVKVNVDGANKLNQLGDGANKAAGAISGLAAGILGVGFGAFIQGALKSADAMVDLSDATGLTVASVKAFGESMRLAGGNSAGAERAIMTLFSSIEAAADGGQKAQESFAKVGVTIKDLETLSEADILQKTIEGLAEIPAGSERAAAATALLGRSFRGVEAERFLETLDPARFAEFEASAQRAADTVEKFENIFQTLQEGALAALDPMLNLIKDLNLTAKDAERMFQILGVALAGVFAAKTITMVMGMVTAVKTLTTALRGTVIAQTALTALAGPKGWAIIAAGVTASAAAYVALDKAIGDANETAAESPLTPGPNKLQATASGTGPVKRNIKANPEVEAAQKAAAESQRRIELSQIEFRKNQEMDLTDQIKNIRRTAAADIEKIEIEVLNNKLLNATQKEREISARRLEINSKAEFEINKLRAEGNKSLDDQFEQYKLALIPKQREIELTQQMLGLSAQEQAKRRQILEIEREMLIAIEKARQVRNADPGEIEATIQKIRDEADVMREMTIANAEYQNSFAAGWERAFTQFMDSATNSSRIAENIFSSMTSNMNSALDSFVDNGKFSFNDLASSIIRDILKIQLRAAAANLFSSGANFLGFTLPGRATGGPVSAGMPYMIGERGPEMFIPAQAGNIVPNNKLSGMGGGGSNTYITNNISAIDSKSVAQLFAENRQTLFGNVEQARRELPLRTR